MAKILPEPSGSEREGKDDFRYASAAEVRALEAKGWTQEYTEDGFEYWTHRTTGETRWAQFMDEVLAEKRDEGLGEIGSPDDFTESAWLPPSFKEAQRRAHDASFENGAAPLWGTRVEALQVFGAGVRLYFVFVRTLGFIFATMTLSYIPSLLLCRGGSGTPEEAKDSLSVYLYSLANVGTGSQPDNGLFTERISWLGREYMVREVGLILSLFTILGAAVALVGWFFFRSETTRVVNQAREQVVTASQYGIFVTHIHSNDTKEDMAAFFSRRFDVQGKDWKDRDTNEDGTTDFPHASLYGGDSNPRVTTTTHLPLERQEIDASLVGTGVAEVSLIYSDAEAIGTFISRQKEAAKVKRTRAFAKMYSEDTRLPAGPNPDQRHLALEKELELTAKFDEIADKLDRSNKLQTDDLDCIGAFIIFNSALARDRCVQDFSETNSLSMLPLWLRKIPEPLLFSDSESKPRMLRVTHAPPPEDVLWENIHFLTKPFERRLRRMMTTAVTLALLAASAGVVGFTVSLSQEAEDQLPDLSLCAVSAKAPYVSAPLQSDTCSDISNLELKRPTYGSSDRERLDELCDAVRPGSFFVVYTEPGEAAEDYLDWSSTYVEYADASSSEALEAACSDECPINVDGPKCPCVRASVKELKGCDLNIYDEDTCSVAETSGTSDGRSSTVSLHGSLHAACYCSSLLNSNIESRGTILGMQKSYNSDRDLCTDVFETFAVLPVFQVLVSLITALVNQGLGVAINRFVELEGHTHYGDLQLRLLHSLFIAQIVNTLVLPLLVNGKPSGGWPFPFLDQIFSGTHENFMYMKDGRVYREWYSDVGNGFVVTFAILVLYQLATLLWKYGRFRRKCQEAKRAFQKPSGTPSSSDEESGEARSSEEAISDKFAMQSDLDEVLRGPPFEVTRRLTHALTLAFFVMLIGPAFPILFPMATVSFGAIYWTDKLVILRFYTRPEGKLDRQLQDPVNSYFAWAIILHLLFSVWIYSNPILSERNSMSIVFSWVTYVLPGGGKLNFEASRAPFLFALVVLVMYILLPSKAIPGVRETLRRLFKRRNVKDEITSELALFTEEYYRVMPEGYVLSEHDKAGGWRYDAEKRLRYKAAPDGRTMKTWEVIRENGLHTFRRGDHPKYREATRALEERIEMTERGDEDDGASDESDDDEVDASFIEADSPDVCDGTVPSQQSALDLEDLDDTP